MSGRAAGYCAGYDAPGYVNRAPRGGFGRGAGWGGGGRSWRNRFHATGLPGWARSGTGAPKPDTERQFLEQEVHGLRARLDEISRRLGELESPADSPKK